MGCALCRRPPTIAHCFKTCDSWFFWKQILQFLVRKPGNVASLAPPRWHLGIQVSIFINVGSFLLPILEALGVPVDQRMCYFHDCWVWICMSGALKTSNMTNCHCGKRTSWVRSWLSDERESMHACHDDNWSRMTDKHLTFRDHVSENINHRCRRFTSRKTCGTSIKQC